MMLPVPDYAAVRSAMERERQAERRKVWVKAWASVGSSFNAKPADCTRYADACLRDWDERVRQFQRPQRERIAPLRCSAYVLDAFTISLDSFGKK